MGRVVEDGEPAWLPEDRDIVDVYGEMMRTRHECGRWEWEHQSVEGLIVDYNVCPFCREIGEFSERLRDDRKNMYGVTYGWFPPRLEGLDGD